MLVRSAPTRSLDTSSVDVVVDLLTQIDAHRRIAQHGVDVGNRRLGLEGEVEDGERDVRHGHTNGIAGELPGEFREAFTTAVAAPVSVITMLSGQNGRDAPSCGSCR